MMVMWWLLFPLELSHVELSNVYNHEKSDIFSWWKVIVCRYPNGIFKQFIFDKIV